MLTSRDSSLLEALSAVRDCAGDVASQSLYSGRSLATQEATQADEHLAIATLLVRAACDAAMGEEVAPETQDRTTYGAQVALQGVPVAAVVKWVRTLERTLCKSFRATSESLSAHDVNTGIERISMFFDDVYKTELAAYASMYDDLAGWHRRITLDLVTRLASGAAVDTKFVNDQARILGIDPHQAFRAVAVRVASTGDKTTLAEVRQAILRLFEIAELRRHTLTSESDDGLLILGPQQPHAEDLADLLQTALNGPVLSKVADATFFAVGEASDSLAGAGRSCRQALSALHVAESRQSYGAVTRCTDVILEVLLMHNRWVCHRLVESRLGPLLESPHLLETLRCYIRCQLSPQNTATEMHLHANTVAYRMKKISGLLRRDLHDLTEVFDLNTALTALEVLQARTPDARDGSHGGDLSRGRLLDRDLTSLE